MVMLNSYSDPVCHSYLFPYFWTFWSIMGCSTAASAEWSQDLKQVTAVLRAARCIAEGRRNAARCFTGRRRNADRSGQILARRKSSDCQEFCKPEISMCVGRKTLTLNMNVKPPCDNLEVNPCHVHVIGVRICLKGLLQMATLMLPHFPLSWRLVYLSRQSLYQGPCVVFLPAMVLRENSGSQCYRICTTLGSHQKMSWRYFTLWNWEGSGLASGSQTCRVSLVLGLSRFMESCLYFLKCYTCSDKPPFSFWNCEES